MNRLMVVAMISAIWLAVAGGVRGQSLWSGGAGNWSSNGSPGWNGTGVPNAVGATGITSAATGNITVNGSYTIGTLTHNVVGTSRVILNGGASTLLTFDVPTGTAFLDMGTNITRTGHAAWSPYLQLNDDLTILSTIATSGLNYDGRYLSLNAPISGTGALCPTNTIVAPAVDGTFWLRLSSPNNPFSGGVRLSPGCGLNLQATNAAGSGLVDFSGVSSAGFASFSYLLCDSKNQQHTNAFRFRVPGTGSQAWLAVNGGITVDLAGPISTTYAASHPTLALRTRFNSAAGTLILGGDNSGWTGDLYLDGYDSGWGGTLIVNHQQALPERVQFDCNNTNLGETRPRRISLLFNVSGTFTEKFDFSGHNGDAKTNFPTLGTTSAMAGTVTLNSATAIRFRTLSQPLSLDVANAGATLELVSSITDGGGTYGPVVKKGPGTAILAGPNNNWGGATTISNGTLFVNSAIGWGAGTNSLTVLAGATLGGTGVVRTAVATVAAGGTLAPGLASDAIGTLTATNLVLAENANLRVNGDSASSDLVRVLNSATLPAALTVTVTRADSSILHGTQTILDASTGSLTGTPAAWTVVAPIAGYSTILSPDGKQVLLRGPFQGTLMMIQ